MRFFFLIFTTLLISNCAKKQTVLICGDHVCVNKNEAEQYFEENLSIEVKIVEKKVKEEIDLVELNMRDNTNGNRKIAISSKKNTNQNVKILTNNEIKIIKDRVRNKNKQRNVAKKTIKKKEKKIISKNNNNLGKSVNKTKDNFNDVCTILKNCSIDEISKYLLELGKNKDFPDITKRQ